MKILATDEIVISNFKICALLNKTSVQAILTTTLLPKHLRTDLIIEAALIQRPIKCVRVVHGELGWQY